MTTSELVAARGWKVGDRVRLRESSRCLKMGPHGRGMVIGFSRDRTGLRIQIDGLSPKNPQTYHKDFLVPDGPF